MVGAEFKPEIGQEKHDFIKDTGTKNIYLNTPWYRCKSPHGWNMYRHKIFQKKSEKIYTQCSPQHTG